MTETTDHDDAVAEYERSDDFLHDAIDEAFSALYADALPADLAAALTAWYRTTETYGLCVEDLQFETRRLRRA